MIHHCHAMGCKAPCPPRMLMCREHWSRVPADLQREVYRTVGLRGRAVDATWAPWWRAAHRAIAAVARYEDRYGAADVLLARELAFADRLASGHPQRGEE